MKNFKKIYKEESKRNSGRFAMVYDLREKLGEGIDDYIEEGMVSGKIAGKYGDPSRLTKSQLKRSFKGTDGEIYIAITLR